MGDNSRHQMIGSSLGESVNPNGCTMKHEATTPQALTWTRNFSAPCLTSGNPTKRSKQGALCMGKSWDNPRKNGGLGKPSINAWGFNVMFDYCRVSQAWIHTEGMSQRVFNPQSTYTTIGPTIIMKDLASDILWRQLIYGNRDRMGSFMVHWPVRLRLAKIFEFEPAIPIVTQKRIEKDWNWSLLSEDWILAFFIFLAIDKSPYFEVKSRISYE